MARESIARFETAICRSCDRLRKIQPAVLVANQSLRLYNFCDQYGIQSITEEVNTNSLLTKLRQFLGMMGCYQRFIFSISNKVHVSTIYIIKETK